MIRRFAVLAMPMPMPRRAAAGERVLPQASNTEGRESRLKITYEKIFQCPSTVKNHDKLDISEDKNCKNGQL